MAHLEVPRGARLSRRFFSGGRRERVETVCRWPCLKPRIAILDHTDSETSTSTLRIVAKSMDALRRRRDRHRSWSRSQRFLNYVTLNSSTSSSTDDRRLGGPRARAPARGGRAGRLVPAAASRSREGTPDEPSRTRPFATHPLRLRLHWHVDDLSTLYKALKGLFHDCSTSSPTAGRSPTGCRSSAASCSRLLRARADAGSGTNLSHIDFDDIHSLKAHQEATRQIEDLHQILDTWDRLGNPEEQRSMSRRRARYRSKVILPRPQADLGSEGR